MNCIYQQHFNRARFKHLCPGEKVAYSSIYFSRINMQLRQNTGKMGDGLQTLTQSSNFLVMTFFT